MLHLYQYSLYYYKKATTLKSNDARMWCAVGNCYSKLSMKLMAIQTLNHAVSCGDREGVATRELARLYREAGQVDLAAECYRRHLQATATNDGVFEGVQGFPGSEYTAQGMQGMYMEGDELQQGLSSDVLAHYLSPSTEVNGIYICWHYISYTCVSMNINTLYKSFSYSICMYSLYVIHMSFVCIFHCITCDVHIGG